MALIKTILLLYCGSCSAMFESNSQTMYQPCPRCGTESMRAATMDRPIHYVAADPTCIHARTDAWKINEMSYLYCSICRKVEE